MAIYFGEKEKGASNEEIQKGVIAKGLSETHASQIVNTLESKVREMLNTSDTEMLTGGIICTVGIAITIFTFSNAMSGGTYVIAWGAIILGAIRFSKGFVKQDQIQKDY